MKAIFKQKRFFASYPFAIFFALCNLQATAQLRADFSADVQSGCTPVLVRFTDRSTGNPTRWRWELGNRTSSSLQHPSVTYFAPGFYTVKLTVYAGNQKDSIIKTSYINVIQLPSVDFTADHTLGCTPMLVNFTDQSLPGSGSIAKWKWDFGDGNLDTVQHPQHPYTQTGAKSVTLQVTNSGGCVGTVRKAAYINSHTVAASFRQRIFSTCASNKVVFINTSTGTGIISKQWYFGDGTTSVQDSVVHSYATGGMYSVKLVVQNQFGCMDSTVLAINVQNPVTAAFTADRTTDCKTPFSVNFTSQSIPGSLYQWTFGDSTTSTVANPVKLYTDSGNFTVKLRVRHPNGCSDSLTRVRYIQLQRAFSYFENIPDSGCAPFTKTFSASLTNYTNVSSLMWQFGDGNSSAQISPVHTYNNLGRYNVSLIATTTNGCRDTLVQKNAILVSTKPTAGFSASSVNACGKTPIIFSNQSTGGSTASFWSFGDDKFSEEQLGVHVYTDTGWMTVSLVTMNGGCADTSVRENYVYIKPAIARFTFDMNCATPRLRTFKNKSLGANRYRWDFGDSTTSAAFEPSHTFPRAGFYTVKLTAYNDITGCDYIFEKVIRIIDLVPNFSVSSPVICKGITDTFTASLGLTEGVFRYFWAFGDGLTANAAVPTMPHVYKKTGFFHVMLIVKDSLNCFDTIVKPLFVKVNAPKPNFKASPAIECWERPVTFIDSSAAGDSGPLREWVWLYGDGSSDTLTNGPFVHSYGAAGSYKVVLKLTDSAGCSDSVRINPLLLIVKLNPAFTVSDTVACPGTLINFACAYSSPGLRYRWDFGDGASSVLQRPSHTYLQAGNYTVKLFLRTVSGCEDSSVMVNRVKVTNTTADFSMSDSFKVCPPLLIQFTNQSANAVSEFWDFGDSTNTTVNNPSHFYTNPGLYTVTLYSKGPSGCISTRQRTVLVKGPKGTFSYNPLRQCKPYVVNFTTVATNAVTYIWDFNDGNTFTGSAATVSHTYEDSGNFAPKLILVDDAGCRVAIRGRDTIKNLFVKASFRFPTSLLCDGGTVNFSNTSSSSDSITVYRWNFGDGQFSFAKDPAHQYRTVGTYYPSLQITTRNGCSDNYRSILPVRVTSSPAVSISGAVNGCAPLTVQVRASQNVMDTSTIVQWNWNMGNGDSSAAQLPPSQLYNLPGIYTINLSVRAGSGCMKTIQQRIEAFAAPTLRLSADSIVCRGSGTVIQASGAARYRWDAAAGLICDTCAATSVSPLMATFYRVMGTNLQGCSSFDSLKIAVIQPFTLTSAGAKALCAGQKTQLQAGGAVSYEWTPATGLSDPLVASPEASPNSTTNYRVIGKGDNGCFADTGYVNVIVHPIPLVNAGADKEIQPGNPIDLVPEVSADVTEVRWSPTGDQFRNSENAITVRPPETTEYTVKVKNAGGCTASDKVIVSVKPGAPNVFVPNLFSPNNDGVNDVFYPRGTGISKVKTMAVFNRWGEMVFQKNSFNSNDPSVGWDGTYRGGKVPADVYVYVIEFIGNNSSVIPYKGNVTLSR